MSSSKRAWIYAGIGLAAGVGLVVASSKSKSTKSRSLAHGERVLLVGDSLAHGLAVPMKQLAKENGIEFLADARLGTRIDQWAKQPWLSQVIALLRPTLILVSLGTNDMLLQEPSVEKLALAQLTDTLRRSGARIAWVAPPKMPFPDRGVRSMIDKTGLSVFSSDALVIPRGPDGIHPTAGGYAGWAGALWAWLGHTLSSLGAIPMHRRFPAALFRAHVRKRTIPRPIPRTR